MLPTFGCIGLVFGIIALFFFVHFVGFGCVINIGIKGRGGVPFWTLAWTFPGVVR